MEDDGGDDGCGVDDEGCGGDGGNDDGGDTGGVGVGVDWYDCAAGPDQCRNANDDSWRCQTMVCEASGSANCDKLERSPVCGTDVVRTDPSNDGRIRCTCVQDP